MVSGIDHHSRQHLKEVLVRRRLDPDDHANPSLIVLAVRKIPTSLPLVGNGLLL